MSARARGELGVGHALMTATMERSSNSPFGICLRNTSGFSPHLSADSCWNWAILRPWAWTKRSISSPCARFRSSRTREMPRSEIAALLKLRSAPSLRAFGGRESGSGRKCQSSSCRRASCTAARPDRSESWLVGRRVTTDNQPSTPITPSIASKLPVVWRRSWKRIGRTTLVTPHQVTVRGTSADVGISRRFDVAAALLSALVSIADDDAGAAERAAGRVRASSYPDTYPVGSREHQLRR